MLRSEVLAKPGFFNGSPGFVMAFHLIRVIFLSSEYRPSKEPLFANVATIAWLLVRETREAKINFKTLGV